MGPRLTALPLFRTVGPESGTTGRGGPPHNGEGAAATGVTTAPSVRRYGGQSCGTTTGATISWVRRGLAVAPGSSVP